MPSLHVTQQVLTNRLAKIYFLCTKTPIEIRTNVNNTLPQIRTG